MIQASRTRPLVAQRLFLVLLLVVVGLSGCQPRIAPPENTVHLTLWHGVNPPPNRDVLQQLVDRFNQTHPTIQVEPLYIGQPDQQMPKILAAIVGNAAPNLLWFSPVITGQLVELEAIRPLDDWLANSPLETQLDPVLFASMELEGHRWSIPFGTNNVGIFYRPSLFAAAGIKTLPTSWQELRQITRQLTFLKNGKWQHGMMLPLGKGEWTVFTWLPFLWSGGGELQENSTAPVTLVTSGAIAALELWHDLLKDGAILSQPERGYELDDFLAGTVAMQLTGPWTLRQLNATSVDFAVMPVPTGTRPATGVGGENLFLLKASPQEEQAAIEFMSYVLSEEFQTEWAIETGYLPVNIRSRQSQPYQTYLAQNPAVSVFLQQAADGRSRPIGAGYNRISESLGQAIEAVLLNKRTPLEALQMAQDRLELSMGIKRTE